MESKNQVLWVNGSVDIALLQSKLGKHHWKALWLLSKMASFASWDADAKRYKNSTIPSSKWITLNSSYLRRYMSARQFRSIISVLEELKYIEVSNSFKVGAYSKKYRFLLPTVGVKIECLDKTINRKIAEDRSKKAKDKELIRATDIDSWLLLSLEDASVRCKPEELGSIITDDFSQWLKFIRNYQAVEKINDGGFDYHIDEFGNRRHTDFTRLNKCTRPYIYFKSMPHEKLVSIDITNSQPLFLSLQLIKTLYPHLVKCDNIIGADASAFNTGAGDVLLCCVILGNSEVERDVVEFISTVINGRLYETIGNAIGCKDRDVVKKQLFTYIIYGEYRDRYENIPIVQFFKRQYPTVWKYINDCKSTDYKNIAKEMQRCESDFMFNHVLPRIRAEHPDARVLTVHDSIICSKKDSYDIHDIMMDEMNKMGMMMELRLEDLVKGEKV